MPWPSWPTKCRKCRSMESVLLRQTLPGEQAKDAAYEPDERVQHSVSASAARGASLKVIQGVMHARPTE